MVALKVLSELGDVKFDTARAGACADSGAFSVGNFTV